MFNNDMHLKITKQRFNIRIRIKYHFILKYLELFCLFLQFFPGFALPRIPKDAESSFDSDVKIRIQNSV